MSLKLQIETSKPLSSGNFGWYYCSACYKKTSCEQCHTLHIDNIPFYIYNKWVADWGPDGPDERKVYMFMSYKIPYRYYPSFDCIDISTGEPFKANYAIHTCRDCLTKLLMMYDEELIAKHDKWLDGPYRRSTSFEDWLKIKNKPASRTRLTWRAVVHAIKARAEKRSVISVHDVC